MTIEKGQAWRTRPDDPLPERYTYLIVATYTLDGTRYVWHTSGREKEYMISASEYTFLQYAEPVPHFFEENKTYEHKGTGSTCTIWHVLKMERGMVAVVQRANGQPSLFVQEDWDNGNYVEV